MSDAHALVSRLLMPDEQARAIAHAALRYFRVQQRIDDALHEQQAVKLDDALWDDLDDLHREMQAACGQVDPSVAP